MIKRLSQVNLGKIIPIETRRKISESNKGKLIGSKNPRYGIKITEEERLKISLAVKGENNGMYGKHHTEESKRKMSLSLKGKFGGIKNPFYGKKHSEETKRKISEARAKKTILYMLCQLGFSQSLILFLISKCTLSEI